jgi:hypothetical protein
MRFGAALSLTLCVGMLRAEIVDRIAVIVDNRVIKQSDIEAEVRVTDFVNGEKLDMGIAAQKQAASRLIDQKVIRKAMEMGVYPQPAPAEAEPLLKQIRQRYSNDAAYHRALASYGLNEATLKQHLLWQIAVLRFISLRFPTTSDGAAVPNNDQANEQFFAWLDQSRKDSRIEFKREDLK